MARSRSSFELTSAIATASTLATAEKRKKPGASGTDPARYQGVALVSFTPADAPTVVPPAPVPSDHGDETEGGDEREHAGARDETAPSSSRPAPQRQSAPALAIPPPPPASLGGADALDETDGGKPRPPRLPDLSNVVSPIVRCEKIIEWIAEATGGTGVFIADADGLPVAGELQDAEARIGASGLVASSIATLLAALPGHPSPLFEVHIGEGPYFQLIGFLAAKGTYVVGLTRQTPLSPRQAHAIRLACRHAFGESLGGAAGSRP